MVLDKTLNLGSYFSAIPTHDQHLANRPVTTQAEKPLRQRLFLAGFSSIRHIGQV